MKSLYNIQSEYLQLAEVLTSDELTEDLEQRLIINESEMQEKSINYGFVIKHIESDIDIIDAEIDRLNKLREIRSNAIDRLKTSLKTAMQVYGVTEIKSPTLKINFRKSESVIITDSNLIPDDFKRVIPEKKEPDKVKIKDAIKSGESVLGAELVVNQNIQIK